MKRTGWYRGDQKPVRVGVYERKYSVGVGYCFYCRGLFSMSATTPQKAYTLRVVPSAVQDLPWRGLAKEPK